jgi:hypothetical protein
VASHGRGGVWTPAGAGLPLAPRRASRRVEAPEGLEAAVGVERSDPADPGGVLRIRSARQGHRAGPRDPRGNERDRRGSGGAWSAPPSHPPRATRRSTSWDGSSWRSTTRPSCSSRA